MATPDEIFDDASGDVAIGDLGSAVEKYRRCVQLDPDFFDGWHALGMALMKLGRFDEAIEAGKRAVELRPNDQIGKNLELGRQGRERIISGCPRCCVLSLISLPPEIF